MKKLQDYLVLVVVVGDLSQAPVCFLFDCCIFIVRFALLSCYSSVRTRLQLVKLHQVNESFCSITHCVSHHIVCCLIAVSTCLHCLELSVCPLSLPRCFYFESDHELEPTPESHFIFFDHFSHRIFLHDFTVVTLRSCKYMPVPFNICEFSQILNKFISPYYSPTAVS